MEWRRHEHLKNREQSRKKSSKTAVDTLIMTSKETNTHSQHATKQVIINL